MATFTVRRTNFRTLRMSADLQYFFEYYTVKSCGNKNFPPDKMFGRSKVLPDKTDFFKFIRTNVRAGAISRLGIETEVDSHCIVISTLS